LILCSQRDEGKQHSSAWLQNSHFGQDLPIVQAVHTRESHDADLAGSPASAEAGEWSKKEYKAGGVCKSIVRSAMAKPALTVRSRRLCDETPMEGLSWSFVGFGRASGPC
jgi:hypothetical protein